MKDFLMKIGLFFSSFTPLYFLVIIKELTEIINGNMSFTIVNLTMLCFNLILTFVGIISIIITVNQQTFNSIEIISVKNVTREYFFPYFPIFVLFALAFELEFVAMSILYVLIIAMIGIVYIKNELFYINPFLNILGFSTFEITYKIGNKTIENKRIFCKKDPFKTNYLINNNFLK